MKMHVDLQKRFPIYHVSQMLGGPSLLLGDTNEGLNMPSNIGGCGKNTWRLVTWEFPLRTDSASWKSLESFIQFTSFCNSCTLPDNSKIVFWSSMSFRLASVSKVELLNFRNSSISVRLCWWTSRKSICCRHNSSRRIRRSFFCMSCMEFMMTNFLAIFCDNHLSLFVKSSPNLCIWAISLHWFPCSIDLFFILGVFRKIAALYVFLVTPKPIVCSTSLSPTGFHVLSNTTDNDDWLTDTPSGSQ